MGRSVNYLSRATKVSYLHVETTWIDEETKEEIEDNFWYDDLKDNIESSLKTLYPSLTNCERWDGNEVFIFLENNLVEIAISEYCGLVSISIRPNSHWSTKEQLAEHWINKVWHKAEEKFKDFSDVLVKQGTFSNGESVYSLSK
jgi:hypothetical protein